MKEKKNVKKVMMTTVLVAAGIVMIGGNSSKAVLQANQTTHASPKSVIGASWIEEIRKMETSGQTMGLTETLNDDLSPKTSNNIDVHMMRATEYGAMAILSASGFGNPKKLSETTIKTTTGNVTGVYLTGDRWEWTAGVADANTVRKNARYYDLYTTANTSAKIGDALGTADTTNPGCTGWHGAVGDEYLWLAGINYGFCRGGKGIFSFFGTSTIYGESAWYDFGFAGRGVAVVGTGL